MINELIGGIVLSLLGVGGIAATVVQGLINRRKHKSEAKKLDAERSTITVENSIRLEGIAMQRYNNAMDKLDAAEKLLEEVRKDLQAERDYVRLLVMTLNRHNITVPSRP